MEPGEGAASSEGESGGGYTGNWGSVGNVFNPNLGTGIVGEGTAPSFAQLSGTNSWQTANGPYQRHHLLRRPGEHGHRQPHPHERDISIKGKGGLPSSRALVQQQEPQGRPPGLRLDPQLQPLHPLLRGWNRAPPSLAGTTAPAGERFFSTTGHSSATSVSARASAPRPASTRPVERLADGKYRITERSGMKYVFESVNAPPRHQPEGAAPLHRRQNNNTLTLAYGAACGNNLCTVTDGSPGR
nr:hypothetical protein [Thauera sp. K11]